MSAKGFNPRLPGGRRQDAAFNRSHGKRFNPRLPGGRRRWAMMHGSPPVVSIHAFRGEGDLHDGARVIIRGSFNPRLPGGRRPGGGARGLESGGFQSTPSGGKATRRSCCAQSSFDSFNPRLPGGRRRRKARRPGRSRQFQSTPSGGKATRWDSTRCSWHAPFQSTPSGGKATKNRFHAFARCAFQSTPSGGKATAATSAMTLPCSVSIHAFRGEGDW